MKVYNNVIELIGKTPLVKYNENIYLKLEFLNPSHSVKDRASYYMLKDAKESGKINDNTVLIELIILPVKNAENKNNTTHDNIINA